MVENRLTKYYATYEKELLDRLDRARTNSDHPDARGGPIEVFVRELLVDAIPNSCKMQSGHVVCGDRPDVLGTLYDLVIYQPDICGPLSKMDSVYVFPLECVVGIIEITANLSSSKLAKDISNLTKVRRMRTRHYWGSTGMVTHEPVVEERIIPPRCFIFGVDCPLQSNKAVAQSMQRSLKKAGRDAHIHAMYVSRRGCFGTKAIAKDAEPLWAIWNRKKNGLLAFVNHVAVSIHRYPIYPVLKNCRFLKNKKDIGDDMMTYPRLDVYGLGTRSERQILPGFSIESLRKYWKKQSK